MAGNRPSLLGLLSRFGSARCSDPLDQLSGLRSLAADADQMIVDYSASVSGLLLDLLLHSNQAPYRRCVLRPNREDHDLVMAMLFSNFQHSVELFRTLSFPDLDLRKGLRTSQQDWYILPLLDSDHGWSIREEDAQRKIHACLYQ